MKSLVSHILLYFYCIAGVHASNINFRVQHYTTEEGLSQNYIDCIYKDSRGFIWVGTWDGLNRFDGYNFITYRHQPGKNSISDGFINAIVEDKDGNLWIATRYGINKFIFETEKFLNFHKDTSQLKTSISDNWITSLMFDKENNLWIGTVNSGIEKISFNKDLAEIVSIQRFKIDFLDDKSIASRNIYCLLQDHQGYIYIGSLFGLDRLDPRTGLVSKFQDLTHPFYFPATVVHSLFEDSEKNIWVGTENGLLTIDYKKNKLTRFPVDRVNPAGTNKKALANGLVKSIYEDSNGKMLVGTLGGLFILDKSIEEFKLFPDSKEKEYSLNNKFINSIFCDKNGNIWIGTEKGGLNKFNVNQKQFYFFSHEPDNENSLNNSLINSINEDDDYIWIGTAGGGLNRFNKRLKKFDHYPHIPFNSASVSSNFVSAIACKNNEVWLGTWGRGLDKIIFSQNTDKLTFKTYRYVPAEPEGPPFSYISSIIFDNDNNLWIGRPEGLEIYDKKTQDFYVVKAGSKFGNQLNSIGCLYIDSRNYLWVGTPIGLRMIKLKKGISPKDLSSPDSIFYFEHNPNDRTSLSGNYIISILEDKTGSMWFSVYGNGICKLEELSGNCLNAKFSLYTKANGLSNNVVYGMLEDNNHNLWLSTDRGLTRYNYRNGTTTTFFESDGLQSNQFYWSAYYKSKDGTLFFGGTKGLNFFNPDSIKTNSFIPKVVITDFKLFNQSRYLNRDGKDKLTKTISQTSEIELDYNENNISLEFSALSYESPEKNLYKYKLEGFDEDWTLTNANRRFVVYTNLSPGIYYFRVMGSNSDGVWNETPTSVKLIINHPWWETIWFRIFLVLTIIGILVIIYKTRVQNLEIKKIELEKLVMERTSELNESNKSLKKINETKDKLFTIIAHDLKNPFNVILGMMDIIMVRYNRYDDKKKKELLSVVNTSCQNLYKLLDNLLHWARAQSGNIEFNPCSFAINTIIRSNIKLLENQASEKRLDLEYNCDADIIVFADENLTNIVLRNLLNNAIKFTVKGKITITTDVFDEENLVFVRIKDSGIGMEEDKLKEIFNMNSVISTPGTNGETGTGLGLHLCKEFVLKNGGTISAESEVGKGSSIIFTIPLS